MKTILITGSTDGIGKLAAIKIAKDGHRLLLHGRNPEKLKETIAALSAASNNENIGGFIADLSDPGSIQKMIAQITNEHTSLDVLINNAGIFKSPIERNVTGLDIRFSVNYFASYLLTKGLLALLKNSPSPKLINLSSAAQASVSLEALAGREVLTAQEAYAQSKLALTMWTNFFAQQHDFLNCIALNPGSLLNTRMVREAYGKFWSPADKGAAIIYKFATSANDKDRSGAYFNNDEACFTNAHEDVYNQEKIDQLIAATERILKL